MLGLVRRNFWYCTESTKKTPYVTLIWPKLEYTAVSWDPHFKCDIVRLEGSAKSSSLASNDMTAPKASVPG